MNKTKTQQGFSLLVALLAILIFGIVGVTGYLVWTNKENGKKVKQNETSNPAKIETTGDLSEWSNPSSWVEYRNDQFKFSFKHPAEWGSIEVGTNYGTGSETYESDPKYGTSIHLFFSNYNSDPTVYDFSKTISFGARTNNFQSMKWNRQDSEIYYYTKGWTQTDINRSSTKLTEFNKEIMYFERKFEYGEGGDNQFPVYYGYSINTRTGGFAIYGDNPHLKGLLEQIARTIKTY